MTGLLGPIVYRRVGDDWVAYGTISAGLVAGRKTITVQRADGSTEVRTVTRIEPADVVAGVAYNYAYLEPRAEPARPRRRRSRGRGCITGGNCSSFNDGRTCGAADCDGW